jgi:hypothetical protein
MSHVVLRTLATSTAFAALCLATTAQAAGVRVRCDNFPDRSRASVDGRDLAPGKYRAMLTSGNHEATSKLKKAVDDEAEFDFDSDPDDVREGATKIGRGFIIDNHVTGTILDVDGNIVASKTVACEKH